MEKPDCEEEFTARLLSRAMDQSIPPVAFPYTAILVPVDVESMSEVGDASTH